jgi:hypothetical protein
MPTWLAHASEEQKARFRAAISQGQKRSWQNGRKGNHQFVRLIFHTVRQTSQARRSS